MAAVALASFLILHCVPYLFLTGQFNVPFPKIFDTLGSSLLGFLVGFLVWSFLTLLIYTMPVSQNKLVQNIGFAGFRKTGISYISSFCNSINAIVSYNNGDSAEQTINELLKGAEEQVQTKTPEKPALVAPVKPTETRTSIPEQNEPGPPPKEDI
ncbi:MAG: hypothetical protein PHF37_10885 [Phycisphaerae bacterium]|nr:hypothetical protein [Phycisphaerae bacterium]